MVRNQKPLLALSMLELLSMRPPYPKVERTGNPSTFRHKHRKGILSSIW